VRIKHHFFVFVAKVDQGVHLGGCFIEIAFPFRLQVVIGFINAIFVLKP
jgi:hypothetical protein